ncbi:MAG: BlaI/MecI/CopY family transcriptional regulator, partial [Vicinamibacteraceae bacterium]|nr:BlaI/MecI/CopY family transcriptional regulator [Vicinamibacteraceae bacterium]
PVSVGEAADGFGGPRELSRTTVLTMMERLRQKGRLSRRRLRGVYRYQARAAAHEVVRDVVRGFVERTLDGSVGPLVAYLAEQPGEVTDDELAELEALVARLQARRDEGGA